MRLSLDERTTGRELVLLVHRQMRLLTGAHPDLEDLVQTALEQILRAEFRGQSRWGTFTHAICYRVWLKHLRFTYRFKKRFSPVDDVQELSAPVEPLNAEVAMEMKERYQRLYKALDCVSKKRRAVVVMHDISGLDVPEIAMIVGAKESTVRSRLRDGRKKLAEQLQSDEYFGPTLQWCTP